MDADTAGKDADALENDYWPAQQLNNHWQTKHRRCWCFTVGFSEGYPEESGYE